MFAQEEMDEGVIKLQLNPNSCCGVNAMVWDTQACPLCAQNRFDIVNYTVTYYSPLLYYYTEPSSRLCWRGPPIRSHSNPPGMPRHLPELPILLPLRHMVHWPTRQAYRLTSDLPIVSFISNFQVRDARGEHDLAKMSLSTTKYQNVSIPNKKACKCIAYTIGYMSPLWKGFLNPNPISTSQLFCPFCRYPHRQYLSIDE